MHDAFVRCVGRFGHLRAHEAFNAYLRRTIVNLHTSRLRRVRVEREWLSKETASRVERPADVGLARRRGARGHVAPAGDAAASPTGGAGPPLLRGPVGTRDGGCAAVFGRRREVTDGAGNDRAARRDQG